MWWKSRSPKEKEKLGESTCIGIPEIKITKNSFQISGSSNFYNSLEFSDWLSLELMAIADGFDNWQQLIDFFESTHGLPFTGDLIEWDSIKSPF
ncbi:MAG: hypothetical protein ACKPCM_08055 [Pseudanabaena sp.]